MDGPCSDNIGARKSSFGPMAGTAWLVCGRSLDKLGMTIEIAHHNMWGVRQSSGYPRYRKTRMPNVKIFSSPMCGACEEAKSYFKEKNIPFESFEVRWDSAKDEWADSENARLMHELCGEAEFVPQIVINGHHVNGWVELQKKINPAKSKKCLNQSNKNDSIG